ncbi:MAG: hypothetical protein NTY50_13010 [Methylobacter sp.]|nr:hypothetical protein [Methylobacter sp.]
MNRLPETVTSKFTELFAALHYAADNLKIVGQEAILGGDFSQVIDSMEACKKLQALEADIKTAISHFHNQYPTHLMEKHSPNKHDKKITRKRGGGHLRVSVAGRVIEETTIRETFTETLKVFGLKRVEELSKTVAKTPLLSRTKNNGGYQAQWQCGDWYITTNVNKVTAKMMLEDIAKALNEPLKIECIEQ